METLLITDAEARAIPLEPNKWKEMISQVQVCAGWSSSQQLSTARHELLKSS